MDGDRGKRNPADGAERGYGWLVWVVLGVVALFYIFDFSPSGAKITTSELKQKIRNGEVASVRVRETEVRAEPKDDALRQKDLVWVAGRGDTEALERELDQNGVPYSYETGGGLLSAILPWLLTLGLVMLFWGWMMRRMRPGAGMMAVGKSRAKLVAEKTGVTFGDVAGVEEAVEELREIVDFLAEPERFRRLGARIPKGVLLVGPPGTGKTLLARAVAGEANVPFFQLTGSDFVEMFVGVGAARVRDLFQQAQSKAPCIVFIDELDAIGKARGVGVMAGHDEREQTLNQLLAEMDGFDPRRGLIMVAATNRPEILDPALLRPGRFDRHVLVDRPDVRGREAILRVHSRDVTLGPDADLRKLAALTPGFAGAELANLINEGALLAARRGKSTVTMAELSEAIERVVAGLEKKNRRMNEREKRVVAHHESGHALLAEVLPTTDRVHKVSIIPRGLGALGYTLQLPLEDRYLAQKRELDDRITVLMGGRAAEMIIFDEVSTGAQDDLERATDLARRMIVQFGMSETLGPQAYGTAERESRFLPGLVVPGERRYGEKLAQTVDSEVQTLLCRCFDRAVEVIRHNRPQLEVLAAALLHEEVIEGERLRELLGSAQMPPSLESLHEKPGPELRTLS